jgi:hypothetical protein
LVFLEELGMLAVLKPLERPGVHRVRVPTVPWVLLSLRHACSLGANR